MDKKTQKAQWTESDRLKALERYAILDTPPEQSYDNIVQMASLLLDAPIAAVNLIAADRQWFKAEIGLGTREMPLDDSICIKFLLESNLIVPDMTQDPRFQCNRLVAGEPGLRFYAGELLLTPDGYPLGTLCVLDFKPRPQGLTREQQFFLKALAEQVMIQLELRRSLQQREQLLVEQQRTHLFNRQVLNSVVDYAIISTDLQGAVTSWNEGASNVLGWTEQEMLGQALDRLYTAQDLAQDRPQRERQQALLNGAVAEEGWHVRSNGEHFWASAELAPLKDEQEQIIGFVKILRDRTTQKKLEANLQHLNHTLEKQVAQRTRERDQLWRNSKDMLLVTDTQGLIEAVNPAWTAVLGRAEEDFVGHRIDEFVHPEDLVPTEDALAHSAQAPLASFENRYRHKDGSYRWLAWTAVPEDGKIYASGRDVTYEKKRAEHQTLTNQARLEVALDAGNMGAWQWHADSNEVVWMHGTARLHGLPLSVPHRFPVARYAHYMHPEDMEYLGNAMREAAAKGTDLHVEYRIIWPDGSIHWLEGRGRFVVKDGGKPGEMVGVATDITQRKVTEQNLRFLARASAELADLFDPKSTLNKLASLAVSSFADWCVVDLLSEQQTVLERVAIAHANPDKIHLIRGLGAHFPFSREALDNGWDVVRSGNARLITSLAESPLLPASGNKEYHALLQQLGLRSCIAAPLLSHGKILGVITFISAESGRIYGEEELALAEEVARRAGAAIENASLYQALQQSDRGKDVFLATLAHELRNPLAAISNALGITRLAAEDRKRVEYANRVIERQVNHLSRLVDDLMDISRIATGKIELRREASDLSNILNSAIETCRAQIENMRHEVVLTLPDGPTQLFADPVRLTQVFANLLNNAAKYTSPGGRIDVVLECAGNELVVRVKDTGIGIPPDMLKKIFTIFSQLDHPLERSSGGLGIGLSLVEGLVKLHGGSVEAFSDGPGTGSEFVVRLPGLETGTIPAQTDRAAVSPDLAASRSLKIVVVDDNIDAASTLAEILQVLGQEVVGVAHDGLAAVDIAVQLRPDLVFLDIGLPKIAGYEVAQRLRMRDETKDTVLVALTGWGHEKDRQRAQRAGFDHHLVKPVGLAELQQMLLQVAAMASTDNS